MSLLCDSFRQGSPPEDCLHNASFTWTCRVEGREVRLCGPCNQSWKMLAAKTPGLLLRCPNCAPEYHANRQMRRSEHKTGLADAKPLTGPLAEAFDRALLAEGLSGEARQRILARLASDTDPYVASLLRSVSGAAA